MAAEKDSFQQDRHSRFLQMEQTTQRRLQEVAGVLMLQAALAELAYLFY